MKYLISRNFRKPGNGAMGSVVIHYLVKMNVLDEKLACQLCEIQPDHKVLEVGFGPGLGLKEAFNKISGGSGSVRGIDISERSFNAASQRLKQELDAVKVQLHLGSVTDMPFPDRSFDCIFYTNCFYFWPNMNDAVAELHRVIKPDGVMVTVHPHHRLRFENKFGFGLCGNLDPSRYMNSLERNGFKKIEAKQIIFEKHYLVKMNVLDEKLACQLCEIQPDHKVLEVGFGPGLGLKEAFNKISGGSGSVRGIDISERSFNAASQRLKQELDAGKIQLHLGSVTDMPFPDRSFDCIFHTNCFYFWPNMDDAVAELHRVIKPDGVMVTVHPHHRLRFENKFGFGLCGNLDPSRYMNSLERNGFKNIEAKQIIFEKVKLTTITASAKK